MCEYYINQVYIIKLQCKLKPSSFKYFFGRGGGLRRHDVTDLIKIDTLTGLRSRS